MTYVVKAMHNARGKNPVHFTYKNLHKEEKQPPSISILNAFVLASDLKRVQGLSNIFIFMTRIKAGL